MKRLINFIKRHKEIFLTILGLALLLTMIFSIIMPMIIENMGATLTEKEQIPYMLMFVLSSISLAVEGCGIIGALNEK